MVNGYNCQSFSHIVPIIVEKRGRAEDERRLSVKFWKLVCGATVVVLALSLGLVSGFGDGGPLVAGSVEAVERPNDFVYQLQSIDLDALGIRSSTS